MQAVAERRVTPLGSQAVRHPLFTPGEYDALGGEFWRSCTTVIVPAGTKRYAADLPTARILLVQLGVVLVRSPGSSGVRSMIVCRCSAGAVLPPPVGAEAIQSLTDAWVTVVPPSAWPRLLTFPETAEHRHTIMLRRPEPPGARTRTTPRWTSRIRASGRSAA